jgi:diguanylate cyclase (GGDEF)-like protein
MKWLQWNSHPKRLKTHLIVPIVFVLLFSFLNIREIEESAEKEQIKVSLQQEGIHLSAQIEQRLQEKKKNKENLARLLATRENVVNLVARSDRSGLEKLLKPWLGKLEFDSIAITLPAAPKAIGSRQGQKLLTIGKLEENSQKPLIDSAFKGWTECSQTIDDRGLKFSVATPIADNDKIIAVLSLETNLNGSELKPTQIPNDVELALLDRGKLITTTISQKKLLGFLLRSSLLPERLDAFNKKLKKYNFYATIKPLSQENSLLILIPSQTLFQVFDRREAIESIGSFITILLVAIAGWFLSRKVAKPLEDMVTATKEMVLGNYQKKVPSSNIQELNELANVINHLASQLNNQFASLNHQAFHDPLTDLPNRAFFRECLQQAWHRARRSHNPIAVLFIDLDGFKGVNDSLGHQIGDLLLVSVSRRLHQCLRSGDVLARLGGDEFTILLENINDINCANKIADRISQQLTNLFNIEGHEISISASIGIACGIPQEGHPEDFLRNSDVAMYRAKKNGKANYQVFDLSMKSHLQKQILLETELRQAIEREEFKIYYQPVMQLATDRITEVEALIRWQHPQRGLVSPADFLPLAEQTGLILPLGQWILEKACQETQMWRSQNIANNPLVLNVNFSIQQLQQPKVEQKIARILQSTGINPSCLKLEIAETIMLEKIESNLNKLQDLKALGIKLAIDDFGKGFSRLNSFKNLPIDNLKIDRILIDELGQNVKNTALVNAIIVFAKALNLTSTAEGLETAQQLSQLQTFGCDCAQGYYFTKPLSYDAMSNFLSEDRRGTKIDGFFQSEV